MTHPAQVPLSTVTVRYPVPVAELGLGPDGVAALTGLVFEVIPDPPCGVVRGAALDLGDGLTSLLFHYPGDDEGRTCIWSRTAEGIPPGLVDLTMAVLGLGRETLTWESEAGEPPVDHDRSQGGAS